jgi:TonB family protein
MFRRIPCGVLLFVFTLGLSAVSSCAQESLEGARRVITRVTPQYPSVARSMRLSGTVRVEALVATNGTLKSVEVRGGHPLLAAAAENAVRQWKWEPASRETREMVEIKFTPE